MVKSLEVPLRSFSELPKDTRFCLVDYLAQPSVPEELITKFSIDYVHHPAPLPFNSSWSINYAYKQFVREDDTHFLFTDIDLVFPPDFLVDTVKALNHEKGIVIPIVFYLTHVASRVDLSYTDLAKEKTSSWRVFFGGACFFPAALFEQVHGFDELYVGWGCRR